MTYPLSTFAIEQAELVLSFALYKQEKIQDTYLHTLSNYYLDTLNNKKHPKNISFKKIQRNQLVPSNYYLAVSVNDVEALKPLSHSVQMYEKYALITAWVHKYGPDYFEKMVIIQENSQSNPILIFHENHSQLEDKLIELRNELARLINIQLIFSIGDAVNSLDQLPRSLNQAQLAFESRKADHNFEPIVYYNNSGVQHLMHGINSQEIKYFCESVLQELAYPQTESQIELRDTLKVFLDNQCETTATANQLFVHRNTVKYRIEKCEELLGVDIRDPKTSLNLRVALSMSY